MRKSAVPDRTYTRNIIVFAIYHGESFQFILFSEHTIYASQYIDIKYLRTIKYKCKTERLFSNISVLLDHIMLRAR